MRIIISKMKELECSQDFSHYESMGIFPDAQGQQTLQSLVESSPNFNSSEILWLSLLPVSMKKIRSKMKALACSQHFLHYNPMGAIGCHGNQSSIPIWSKTLYSLSPYPMMLQINLVAIGPLVSEIFMCGGTDRLTDRQQLDRYAISSLCEPQAQVS